jgi:SPP1 family predicted phage head-tail adaptor
MRAGDLRHSILLKRRVATRDEKGNETVTYLPLAKRTAAKVEPIRGREYEALQQAQSEVDLRCTTHYRTDVQVDWRFEWRGTDYEIVGPPIDVNGQKVWTELMCRTAQSV